jgi:predicted GIY-YIG superfamily endonuclease
VYIMASSTGTLYISMTGFFFTRMGQHKAAGMEGFSGTYHCERLVYCESYDNVNKAKTNIL